MQSNSHRIQYHIALHIFQTFATFTEIVQSEAKNAARTPTTKTLMARPIPAQPLAGKCPTPFSPAHSALATNPRCYFHLLNLHHGRVESRMDSIYPPMYFHVYANVSVRLILTKSNGICKRHIPLCEQCFRYPILPLLASASCLPAAQGLSRRPASHADDLQL